MFQPSSSDDDDGDGFPGFSTSGNIQMSGCQPSTSTFPKATISTPRIEQRLSCYECDEIFSNSDESSLQDMLQVMKMGMRWHCPSCLQNPSERRSLQHDLNDFKVVMKRELSIVTDGFNKQLECLQASITNSKLPCEIKDHPLTSNI